MRQATIIAYNKKCPDAAKGQLRATPFMDYLMPRINAVSMSEKSALATPALVGHRAGSPGLASSLVEAPARRRTAPEVEQQVATTVRSGGATPIPTNAWTLTGIQQCPDRFIMCPNFAPIIRRGVQKTIKECVEPFHNLQTDQEGRRGWGYPCITEEDDRAKIFSLNMAKRPGMEPKHRTRTQA